MGVPKRQKPSFLANVDLGAGPEERVGRRKKAKLRKEEKEQVKHTEIDAEQRPRTQKSWQEDARKATKLPIVGGGDGENAAREAHAASAEGVLGKKKTKRLAMLAQKKSIKEGKKASAMRKEAKVAAEGLRGKMKASAKGALPPHVVSLLEKAGQDAGRQQQLLASTAETINANPEGEMALFDIFFELHQKGQDRRTQQLALLSAVAIFKDMVPGYRIREPSQKDLEVKLTKEVQRLQRSEVAILQTYRRLLPMLEAAMKREALVYAGALAALVRVACDFNYRQRLLSTAIKATNSPFQAVRRTMADGLREVLETDQRLEASKELVVTIGRIAQAMAGKYRGSTIPEDTRLSNELLKVLLHIPIGKAEQAELTTVQDNLDHVDEDTQKAVAESSISQGVEKLKKSEAELLYEVFVVYLRILRQRHLHGKDLMSSVLTGLARWGQHVNVELLVEIISELRKTVEESISQANEVVALQGLNCALSLLSGPSQAIVTDATWLAHSMTGALSLALPSLCSAHSESVQWPPPRCFYLEERRLHASESELTFCLDTESVPVLVLKCLQAALSCPQAFGKTSDAAIAGLVEHLFLLAAAADSHVGLALLREASLLLRKHHRLYTLLEMDGGLFGLGGVTDRAISVLWHLQPLAFTLAPEVVRVAKELPLTIPRKNKILSDVFPAKDALAWLKMEFARHLSSLKRAPVPGKARGKRRGVPFMTEGQLRETSAAGLED